MILCFNFAAAHQQLDNDLPLTPYVSKMARLNSECSSPAMQTNCVEGQKWRCIFEDGQWRKHKCKFHVSGAGIHSSDAAYPDWPFWDFRFNCNIIWLNWTRCRCKANAIVPASLRTVWFTRKSKRNGTTRTGNEIHERKQKDIFEFFLTWQSAGHWMRRMQGTAFAQSAAKHLVMRTQARWENCYGCRDF